MNEILVTGANGFIGSNLMRTALARGFQVTGMVRHQAQTDQIDGLDAELVRYAGFHDRDALRRAIHGKSYVFHVAGATKALSPQTLYRVNEGGIRAILKVCSEMETPPVVVYVSSLAAAGPSGDDHLRTENEPFEPVSQYGRSKLAAERAARRWADEIPISIVRPSIVLGPADAEGLAMFRSIRRLHLHIVPGYHHSRYSVVHVNDLCDLMIRAAEQGHRIRRNEDSDFDRAEGCYFASCNEHPTYSELGQMLRKAVGHRVSLNLPIPKASIWFVATGGEAASHLVKRPFYLKWDKAREITAGSWACSSGAAMEQLDYCPSAPLQDQLNETAHWYQEAGWL
ncbi:MAG: NAD-dependent epimerase/dehydratase family protein [Planctomycetia bacterium]|jgi:nucleoside-diphosphate-sugar epimerase